MNDYEVIQSDDVCKEMYEYVSKEMTDHEIKEWLDHILVICTAHSNECGTSPENMDEIDESFLLYENAIFYLLGLVRTNNLLNTKGLH